MAEWRAHMSSPTRLKLGVLFRGQLTRVEYTAQSKAMEWNQPAGPHWNDELGLQPLSPSASDLPTQTSLSIHLHLSALVGPRGTWLSEGVCESLK